MVIHSVFNCMGQLVGVECDNPGVCATVDVRLHERLGIDSAAAR